MPTLDLYRSIRDADLIERAGLFVAEGRLVVRRLLESRHVVRSVLVTDAARAALGDLPPGRERVPMDVVAPAVMDTIAGFHVHRGCLALAERPVFPDWREVIGAARRVVILEGVGNPDNVGAICRGAAAFGVDAILFGPSCCSPFYRKAIRTSMGTVLGMSFATIAPWPDALHALREHGFAVVALTPDPAAAALREAVTRVGDRPIALLAGHEGDGLTAAALAASTVRARVPMHDGIDSLNVATATTIALYEVAMTHDCVHPCL